MPEVFTLTVSTETAERAHKVASQAGKPVEAVLSEWLDQAADNANAGALQADVQYQVWSPFNSTETALALQEFIDQQRKQNKQDK